MHKRYLIIILAFIILAFPVLIKAEAINNQFKVAFIREGFLWTKINGTEEKITDVAASYPPQWSYDGKWISYQKEGLVEGDEQVHLGLWVYNIDSKEHRKINYSGNNPKWSPNENILAFQMEGGLHVSDLNRYFDAASGVADYNWMPDGKGFIASTGSTKKPDGWTNPILYKISLNDFKKHIDKTKNAKSFFVIPNELSKGDVKILSIYASSFEFSPDQKWISFIVSPTASWSMDSNILCVISMDGKDFEVVDEVILHLDNPKWAFQKNLLGYIAGGGRIVFGFKNKDMKITELPSFKSLKLTPPNFAELGFTWLNDQSVIVSRVKESDWSNDSNKRPKPSLYSIDITKNKTTKVTTPLEGVGDYEPDYFPKINKISWIRKTDIASESGDLWIADLDGKHATNLIENVGGYSIYSR
ncbi:TolB family protein [Metabacillus herbersteinensis]|uniref:TolB family protein n=1 Tax=Metabacillus herbersteinensis TaxID=283816 RepID=A0ABV6GA21_9BACI